MIKECNVLLSNDHVAVIDFDGIKVQLPKLPDKDAKKVFVEYKDEKYILVDKAKVAKPKSKKSVSK